MYIKSYLKEKMVSLAKVLLIIVVIAGTVLLAIFVVSVLIYMITPYPAPQPKLLRKAAFNRACEVWNTTYQCNSHNFSDPILHYQDPYDEKEKVYSVNNLCQLLKLNDKTCYERCGCKYG
ncbi:MAG: hypothetical protein NT129_03710 [Candidatus Aenigmarchaeota archaeon]|nr:hypothetical protein [Candidatus Aenigmarchaeota archaeon]